MNKLPDRAKMRREYILQKVEADTLARIGGVTCIGFAAATAVCVAGVLLDVQSRMDFLPGVALFGFTSCLGAVLWNSASRRTQAIPCVPPIREQVNTLPADEVLLRGSQASAASSEELLRPAGSEETKADELLRASARGE